MSLSIRINPLKILPVLIVIKVYKGISIKVLYKWWDPNQNNKMHWITIPHSLTCIEIVDLDTLTTFQSILNAQKNSHQAQSSPKLNLCRQILDDIFIIFIFYSSKPFLFESTKKHYWSKCFKVWLCWKKQINMSYWRIFIVSAWFQ